MRSSHKPHIEATVFSTAARDVTPDSPNSWFNISKAIRLRMPAEEGWVRPMHTVGAKFRPAKDALSDKHPGQLRKQLHSDMPVMLEQSGAVPGDRIVGVLTPEGAIRVFFIGSARLTELKDEPWIDATWEYSRRPGAFSAFLKVSGPIGADKLAQIPQQMIDAGFYRVHSIHRTPDLVLKVGVQDVNHLEVALKAAKEKLGPHKVERAFDIEHSEISDNKVLFVTFNPPATFQRP